jgi:hypothetical protein
MVRISAQVLRRLLSTSPGATSGRMRYIPAKVMDEMAALQEEDPARWTAVTLAMRYDAPQESVAAALLLSKRSSRASHADQRAKVSEAWAKLQDVGHAARRKSDAYNIGRPDVVANEDGSRERNYIKPQFSVIDDIYDAAVVQMQKQSAPDTVTAGSKETSAESSEPPSTVHKVQAEQQNQVELPKAINVESQIKSPAELMVEELLADETNIDLKRKTSYAFFEAGIPHEQRRAVWIRDGSTGRIRLPSDEERAHLLGGEQRRFQKPRRRV